MAQAVPPVPRGLARDMTQFLEALRLSVGGDRATTAPTTQAEVLAPVAAAFSVASDLTPVAAAFNVASDLAPVALALAESTLDPVTAPMALDAGLEPV